MAVHERSRRPFHFVVQMPHTARPGTPVRFFSTSAFLLLRFEVVHVVCIVLYRASVGSALGARLDINLGIRFSSVVRIKQ
jgi:hypothetical protein